MKDETVDDNRARETAQSILDETGTALMGRDFDHFARHFALPQTLVTSQSNSVIRNRDDLRMAFDGICDFYHSVGTTKLERSVEAALFDGPDRIRWAFKSQLIADNAPAREPFRCIACIELKDGVWQITDNQYTLGSDRVHAAALTLPKDEADDLADGTEEPSVEATIAQAALDAITQCYLLDDFARLQQLVQLPLFLQRSDTTDVFESDESLHEDFLRYMTEFQIHEISDIVRVVKSASLIGLRRMQVFYRSYVLRGTDLVIRPYTSCATLEQGDDLNWRLTSVLHPMGHLSWDRTNPMDAT